MFNGIAVISATLHGPTVAFVYPGSTTGVYGSSGVCVGATGNFTSSTVVDSAACGTRTLPIATFQMLVRLAFTIRHTCTFVCFTIFRSHPRRSGPTIVTSTIRLGDIVVMATLASGGVGNVYMFEPTGAISFTYTATGLVRDHHCSSFPLDF